MDKKLITGMLLGALIGVIVVENVPKVKELYNKGQSAVVDKIKAICKKKDKSEKQDASFSDDDCNECDCEARPV